MKVISILQPWATLVAIGAKKIETRSWNTNYRGPILIHASARFDKEQERLAFEWSQLLKDSRVYHCHRGAIIGKAELVATSILCPPYHDETAPFGIYYQEHGAAFTEQELAFGDYSPGRYGWLMADPIQFDEPVIAKGRLGLWEFNNLDKIYQP